LYSGTGNCRDFDQGIYASLMLMLAVSHTPRSQAGVPERLRASWSSRKHIYINLLN
jgi:hypothetical protein